MPDFISHSLFADALLESPSFEGKEFCGIHDNLFRLGSQGADILYYCDYTKPKSGFAELADRLHEKPLSVIEEYIRGILPSENDGETAYLYGFAAHYCLDEAVHPYVSKLQGPVSRMLGMDGDCAHVMIESCVEARELFEKRGIAPKKFAYADDLPKNRAQAELVARAIIDYTKYAKETPPDLGRLICAIERLPLLFSFIFDRSGAVKLLLDAVYAASKKDSALRWHIKRPYRKEFFESVIREEQYSKYEELTRTAAERFGILAKEI